MKTALTKPRTARELAGCVSDAVAGKATIDEWAPAVVEACRGVDRGVWLAYDDAGGSAAPWAGREFWKARRVRNHPEWGPRLFAALGRHRE